MRRGCRVNTENQPTNLLSAEGSHESFAVSFDGPVIDRALLRSSVILCGVLLSTFDCGQRSAGGYYR